MGTIKKNLIARKLLVKIWLYVDNHFYPKDKTTEAYDLI